MRRPGWLRAQVAKTWRRLWKVRCQRPSAVRGHSMEWAAGVPGVAAVVRPPGPAAPGRGNTRPSAGSSVRRRSTRAARSTPAGVRAGNMVTRRRRPLGRSSLSVERVSMTALCWYASAAMTSDLASRSPTTDVAPSGKPENSGPGPRFGVTPLAVGCICSERVRGRPARAIPGCCAPHGAAGTDSGGAVRRCVMSPGRSPVQPWPPLLAISAHDEPPLPPRMFGRNVYPA